MEPTQFNRRQRLLQSRARARAFQLLFLTFVWTVLTQSSIVEAKGSGTKIVKTDAQVKNRTGTSPHIKGPDKGILPLAAGKRTCVEHLVSEPVIDFPATAEEQQNIMLSSQSE